MKKLILAVFAAAIILIFPQDAVNGAQRAMGTWYASVAPALFPFLALMPVLTGAEACSIYNRIFSGVMQRLFQLPGAAAPAMIIGMISGSPGGAIAVCKIAEQGGIGKNEAQRLALALCGLSPAYLVMGIGLGLYGSASLGWKLVLLQAGIQLALLVGLQGIRFAEGEVRLEKLNTDGSGVKGAVENILGICGYMVVFGAVASIISVNIGERPGTFFQLLMDLPGGAAKLAGMEIEGKMLLQCAAIGFGGLCIGAQNMDALQKIGVTWKKYLAVRGIAGGLFACGGVILLHERGRSQVVGIQPMKVYALSLFMICLITLPGMIFLTKNYFFNKRKF